MGVLGRILQRRVDRRRGVLDEDPVDPGEQPPHLQRPEPTAGTPQLIAPEPTPSMRVRDFGTTAGTQRWRGQGGTPSTERLHNPTRPGR
jgi:hypothetical protein